MHCFVSSHQLLFMSKYISKQSPSKRLTIIIDSDMEEKLRELQGNLIISERRNFSLSKIVNMVLVTGLMASDKLSSHEWAIIRSIVYGKKVIIDEMPTKEYVINLAVMGEWV